MDLKVKKMTEYFLENNTMKLSLEESKIFIEKVAKTDYTSIRELHKKAKEKYKNLDIRSNYFKIK